MSLPTRRLFLASLTATPCAFAKTPWAFSKSWDEPAFPSWSADFIDRMLTDSPWAKQSTVKVEIDPVQRMQSSNSFAQIGIPGIGWPTGGSRTGNGSPGSAPWPGSGGGMPTKAEIFLTTRWASALPIRRARALQEYGAYGLKTEEAVELLTAKQTEYAIEVAGFNTTIIRQGAKKFAADLSKTARLVIPGRRPISATDVHVPEHGMHLMATLRFPRLENLEAKEGSVELTAETRGIELHERFKLKDMVYGGSLEL
jgi:hypothetical protein